MKEILFIMKYPTCVPETLKRKFNGQMQACVNIGYKVWYIEWCGNSFELVCKNSDERITLLKVFNVLPLDKYYHTFCFIDLYRAVIRALKKKSFDYVYMRAIPAFPPVDKMVKRINKNKIFLIYEIPTFLGEKIKEKQNNPEIYRKIGMRISDYFSKKVQEKVDLYVLIGKDAGGYVYGKPAINISNGIDVSAVEIKKHVNREETLHFLLLASMCYWHGYDRIIESLHQYKGNQNIILHFVGNDGDGSLAKWKAMIQKYNLKEHVIIHRAVYGKELDALINTMDIGIGSLGLYRQGLDTATIMKGREYMARGIPFIYAGEDPAVADTFPYALKIANDDSSITMEDIVEFAMKMKKDESISLKMRSYAEKYMSWESQFEKIKERVRVIESNSLK